MRKSKSVKFPERSGDEEEPSSHHKSPRVVFMPKSLRDDTLWQSLETESHGWVARPDYESRLPSRSSGSTKVKKGPADIVARRDESAEKQDSASIAWLDEVPLSSRGDAALDRARERNVRRLREATANDCQILSKYLPSNVSIFFPFGLVGPDDYYQPSQGWVNEVIKVATSKCTIPGPPLVRLSLDQEDLDHNTRFLADCDWDLGEVYRRHAGTTADHGSEFRPVRQLQRIVGQHPGFDYLQEMFTSGFDYQLERGLTEQERVAELEAQLDRGNHKSTLQNIDEVRPDTAEWRCAKRIYSAHQSRRYIQRQKAAPTAGRDGPTTESKS